MITFNTIRKNIAIGAVLAATGLPSSLAQAQFKVEYNDADASPRSEKVEKTEHRVIGITSDDGEHSYEIKIVNGAVTLAKLDGKELDQDRVSVKHDVVVFLSKDGKVLHEIKLPKTAQADAPDLPKPLRAMTWVTEGGQAGGNATVEARFEQPKVMLGINLSEPSDAMRKQLRLGADQQVILVEKVIDGLPAKNAGIEDFDVILSIDGSDYANGKLLTDVLSKKNPGDALKLVVLRGGEKMKISAELSAYNAEKLGLTPSVTITRSGEDLDFPAMLLPKGAPNPSQGFEMGMLPQLREQLHKALSASGMSEEEIEKIQSQLHEQLGAIGNRFFLSNDGSDFEIEVLPGAEQKHKEHEMIEIEREHAEQIEQAQRQRIEVIRNMELAELAKDKARQAMRDAERQVMEMRDGRLFVRNAERVEDHMGALEDRLSALEDRLNAQMEQFEVQMERMADMFERLLDRLEARDE